LLLYYISDRTQFGDTETLRRRGLITQIRLTAEAGVDFIQLREKDLPARELESLAAEAADVVGSVPNLRTRFLLNSRCDIAIAAGADGVHLRSRDLAASEARAIFSKAGLSQAIIAVSCHTSKDVAAAEAHGADFAVFGPIFGKGVQPGVGVEQLYAVCNRNVRAMPKMPVLALGGITLENAARCFAAGASGVAGIRLFQRPDIQDVVRQLRARE
jgi:thiamine-phosphate pyrophosphorylase